MKKKEEAKGMNAAVDPVNGKIPPALGEIHGGADLYRECRKRQAWRKRQEEMQIVAMECERTRKINKGGRRG